MLQIGLEVLIADRIQRCLVGGHDLGQGEGGGVERLLNVGAILARHAVVDGRAHGAEQRNRGQRKDEGNVALPIRPKTPHARLPPNARHLAARVLALCLRE